MDSTLPHLKDSQVLLLDSYWTRGCYLRVRVITVIAVQRILCPRDSAVRHSATR
jgi:hypothetical protein